MSGRLAPSPTGVLHVGNARSLLWAWLSARAAGLRILLRVEDLLPGAPEHIASVLADMRWLGLDWDAPAPELEGLAHASELELGPASDGSRGEPSFVLQSRRSEVYRRVLARLTEAGLVYPCVCTRKDIARASRAPHAEDKGRAYPGTCRGRFEDLGEAIRWEGAQALRLGRPPVGAALRLRVPDTPVDFVDALHGACQVHLPSDCGDFVIRKKDGLFAYMFAVVVDDLAMGVTEVVRGDDLLDCTGQQVALYRALAEHLQPGDLGPGATPVGEPTWTHVPLVLGDDGRRLAKRNRSVHVRQLAAQGVAPRELRRWLATSLGLPQSGDLAELVAAWPTASPPRDAVVFTELA